MSSTQTATEVDPLDAILLRGDSHLAGRSTMVAVYVLADGPDWSRTLVAFERASRTVPRLRQRIVSGAVPFSLPCWCTDPDFDLEYHVRRVRIPASGSERELLDFAQGYGAVPLDRARPLWEATVVEGLDADSCGGRAALIVKASHALGDGIAGVAMALALFDFEPQPAPRPMPPVPAAEPVRNAQRIRSGLQQLSAAMAHQGRRNLGRTAAAWGVAGRTPTEIAGSAGDTLRWTRSVVRTLAPPAQRSLAWRGRGQRRRFSVLEVPLDGLKLAGKTAGGTVNDAYVAAVLGGIGRYHEKSGYPIDEIAMAVPVSVRTADDPMGGNRFAAARFAGPAGERDARARIERIHQIIEASRNDPALDALRMFAPVIARLPAAAFDGLRALAMSHDVQVSNIAGYPVPVYFAGQGVLRIYPFGPVPGVAAMIVLISHVGTCYVGINVDPDAVTDPVLFDTCLHEGFNDVLSLADRPSPVSAIG